MKRVSNVLFSLLWKNRRWWSIGKRSSSGHYKAFFHLYESYNITFLCSHLLNTIFVCKLIKLLIWLGCIACQENESFLFYFHQHNNHRAKQKKVINPPKEKTPYRREGQDVLLKSSRKLLFFRQRKLELSFCKDTCHVVDPLVSFFSFQMGLLTIKFGT